MKIIVFNAKNYDKEFFTKHNSANHEFTWVEENLTIDTVAKAEGHDAVCVFVNDKGDADILEKLAGFGIKLWLQRSMGYNRVDLAKAEELGIKVYRVPNYSAETVAEHAASLMMSLNRRLPQAKNKTMEANFDIDGLTGKCIFESTVGVVGSGQIGQRFINIVKGMGAKVIVFDDFAKANFPETADKFGFEWVDLDTLARESDFISLHAPHLPSTEHMINDDYFAKAKEGQIVINAARGPLIDTTALIKALKSGKIAGAGLDVLEREAGRFFDDCSADKDKIFAEDPEWKDLLEMDNVIVTAHQAFLTDSALNTIATTTMNNIELFNKGEDGNSRLHIGEDGKVING